MFNEGDRVYHPEKGYGTVEKAPPGKNVLVRWDTHRVTRTTRDLDVDQSHVSPTSLSKVNKRA